MCAIPEPFCTTIHGQRTSSGRKPQLMAHPMILHDTLQRTLSRPAMLSVRSSLQKTLVRPAMQGRAEHVCDINKPKYLESKITCQMKSHEKAITMDTNFAIPEISVLWMIAGDGGDKRIYNKLGKTASKIVRLRHKVESDPDACGLRSLSDLARKEKQSHPSIE